MNKEKTILFDIDGTLLNVDHRQGFLRNHPKQWAKWEANMHLDTPYDDIVWLVKTFHAVGCCILFVTARNARPEIVMTTKWQLDEVAGLKGFYDKLYMRAADDNRPDNIVKIELLEQIMDDGYDPFMVFEDRNKVVKAWREAGLRCLQVKDGEY